MKGRGGRESILGDIMLVVLGTIFMEGVIRRIREGFGERKVIGFRIVVLGFRYFVCGGLEVWRDLCGGI